MPELSLVVIRVSDIESSKNFYQSFGLKFIREKHGEGPVHFSSTLGNTVFEIYPASEKSPVSSSTRLGFSVNNIIELQTELSALGICPVSSSRYGLIFEDPDGIKVEISARDG